MSAPRRVIFHGVNPRLVCKYSKRRYHGLPGSSGDLFSAAALGCNDLAELVMAGLAVIIFPGTSATGASVRERRHVGGCGEESGGDRGVSENPSKALVFQKKTRQLGFLGPMMCPRTACARDNIT
jgi:hypothetical protein